MFEDEMKQRFLTFNTTKIKRNKTLNELCQIQWLCTNVIQGFQRESTGVGHFSVDLDVLHKKGTNWREAKACNYLIKLPLVTAGQLWLISQETLPAVADSWSGVAAKVCVDKSCS